MKFVGPLTSGIAGRNCTLPIVSLPTPPFQSISLIFVSSSHFFSSLLFTFRSYSSLLHPFYDMYRSVYFVLLSFEMGVRQMWACERPKHVWLNSRARPGACVPADSRARCRTEKRGRGQTEGDRNELKQTATDKNHQNRRKTSRKWEESPFVEGSCRDKHKRDSRCWFLVVFSSGFD